MDFNLIAGSLSSLATLVELGKSAVGIRDAAQMGTVVVQMNEQVLNVQNNLYRHQAELMALQQQFHEAQQKIREFEARQSERDRYQLVEPHEGNFVYRVRAQSEGEPVHMLCQPCFDQGKKSVLQCGQGWGTCNLCNHTVQVGPDTRRYVY